MYLKYAHAASCSWWAKVALAGALTAALDPLRRSAPGLSLLALGGICLRPSRQLRGQPEATTELHAAPATHCGERQRPPPGGQCEVTILHLSDTHARHREMAQAPELGCPRCSGPHLEDHMDITMKLGVLEPFTA